jgi:hypothetical protein
MKEASDINQQTLKVAPCEGGHEHNEEAHQKKRDCPTQKAYFNRNIALPHTRNTKDSRSINKAPLTASHS